MSIHVQVASGTGRHMLQLETTTDHSMCAWVGVELMVAQAI